MLASFFIQLVGVACLSFAMDKYFKSTFKRQLRPLLKRSLRVFGCLAVLLSICILFAKAQVISIAVVEWLAFLSLNILLLALMHCLPKNDRN